MEPIHCSPIFDYQPLILGCYCRHHRSLWTWSKRCIDEKCVLRSPCPGTAGLRLDTRCRIRARTRSIALATPLRPLHRRSAESFLGIRSRRAHSPRRTDRRCRQPAAQQFAMRWCRCQSSYEVDAARGEMQPPTKCSRDARIRARRAILGRMRRPRFRQCEMASETVPGRVSRPNDRRHRIRRFLYRTIPVASRAGECPSSCDHKAPAQMLRTAMSQLAFSSRGVAS